MAVTAEKSMYTVDELWELCHRTEKRLELVRGELREMAPAGEEHGFVTGRAIALLARHVDNRRLGYLFAAETGFVLQEGEPATVRAPDVAFVQRDRLPEGKMSSHFSRTIPDLVVEVLSPSDTYPAVLDKVNDWLAVGVKLVWVVDPASKQVVVHKAGVPARILRDDEVLLGEDVLPGFECKVSEIFAP